MDTNGTKTIKRRYSSTYSSFFNTEPQLGGSLVVGVTAGLEEARANGEEVDSDLINGIRAGLMGPLAGIGDSIVVGTLIPLLLGIALSMSTNGSPVGAIFYRSMGFLYLECVSYTTKDIILVKKQLHSSSVRLQWPYEKRLSWLERS